eukprot:TRINITY_DN213_c0_g1_i10.p3 TRINITY_DN213_c0_g1~~TRINITY_DN213_c0_g1_i10.p3  ORF type:complete len:300 (+),score=37.93 TRINITY_DN213_c0_g1_i10:430-1329(+)
MSEDKEKSIADTADVAAQIAELHKKFDQLLNGPSAAARKLPAPVPKPVAKIASGASSSTNSPGPGATQGENTDGQQDPESDERIDGPGPYGNITQPTSNMSYEVPRVTSHFHSVPGKVPESAKLLLVALRDIFNDLQRVHRALTAVEEKRGPNADLAAVRIALLAVNHTVARHRDYAATLTQHGPEVAKSVFSSSTYMSDPSLEARVEVAVRERESLLTRQTLEQQLQQSKQVARLIETARTSLSRQSHYRGGSGRGGKGQASRGGRSGGSNSRYNGRIASAAQNKGAVHDSSASNSEK